MNIHDRIAAQLPAWRERVNRLRKEFGALKVGEVTVEQIYGGIRGVQIQVSDISYVDPLEGIRLSTCQKFQGLSSPWRVVYSIY